MAYKQTGRPAAAEQHDREVANVALDAQRHRGSRAIAIGLAAVVAVTALAFWAGTAIHGSAGSLPQHIDEPPAVVAVQQQVLTDGLELDGVIAMPAGGVLTPLSPQLTAPGAQPVITALPWRIGMQIADGDVLAEVAGEPIFVLAGGIPAYRDLQYGDSGKDVAQLQAALADAGYPIADPAGSYERSTAAAVAKLYEAHGYEAPRSSSSSAASAEGESTSLAGGISASDAAGAERRWPMLPVWSVVYVAGLPATVSAVDGAVGRRLTGERPLLGVATGAPVAQLDLGTANAEDLRIGMAVKMTVDGHLHLIGHVAKVPGVASPKADGESQEAGGEASSAAAASHAHVPGESSSKLIVRLPPHIDGLALVGQSVKAQVVLASSIRPVLVVPLSAVQNDPNGRDSVEVERDGRVTRVQVTEGLTAAGNVAVTPAAGARLRAGEQVVVPN